MHSKESILEGEPALAHAAETADKEALEIQGVHSLQCFHRYRRGRERPRLCNQLCYPCRSASKRPHLPYIHRAGRTARTDRIGEALILVYRK